MGARRSAVHLPRACVKSRFQADGLCIAAASRIRVSPSFCGSGWPMGAEYTLASLNRGANPPGGKQGEEREQR